MLKPNPPCKSFLHFLYQKTQLKTTKAVVDPPTAPWHKNAESSAAKVKLIDCGAWLSDRSHLELSIVFWRGCWRKNFYVRFSAKASRFSSQKINSRLVYSTCLTKREGGENWVFRDKICCNERCLRLLSNVEVFKFLPIQQHPVRTRPHQGKQYQANTDSLTRYNHKFEDLRVRTCHFMRCHLSMYGCHTINLITLRFNKHREVYCRWLRRHEMMVDNQHFNENAFERQ